MVSQQIRKGQPRRHHYLPQFDQLGFGEGADPRVWVYDRMTQRYFHAHPKSICFENELYTADPEGTADRRIESQVLSQVDGDAAAAIRQINSPEWPKEQWRSVLSAFMAFQITRSPAFRTVTMEAHRITAEEIMRIGFSDVNRARGLMERYGRETGLDLGDVTPESMVDAFVNKRIKAVATERPFLEGMANQFRVLFALFSGLAWTIVGAPQTTGFVTCDYPVVSIPPPGNPQSGPSAYGAHVLFPLTRRHCLYMVKPGDGLRFGFCTRAGTRAINQNIAIASERFVIGPSKLQLDHLVESSRTALPDPLPRATVELIEKSIDGSIVMMTLWPRCRQMPLAP